MRAEELLDAARELLHAGRWPRAAALLARQALEQALADFWRTRAPGMEECSYRAQLDCLGEYLGAEESAAAVGQAWTELTWIVHHQAYEVPVGAEDVRGPMTAIDRFVSTTEEAVPT